MSEQQEINNTPKPHPMNGPISTVVLTMIRGMIVCIGPNLRPEQLLTMISFHVGAILGRLLVGDLASVLKMRRDLQDEFVRGLQSAGIKPPPPDVTRAVVDGQGQVDGPSEP